MSICSYCFFIFFFFFNDTATTEIYTLSLHDALPICPPSNGSAAQRPPQWNLARIELMRAARPSRSEEHTSELQSRLHLVCRLLLEKKKKIQIVKKIFTITLQHEYLLRIIAINHIPDI